MSGSLWTVLAFVFYLAVQAGVDVRAVPQVAPTAVQSQPAAATTAVDAALYAQGKQVYLSQYCGVCHTLAAAGTGGMFGPAHDSLGRHANQRIADPRYQGSATTAEDYIRESIVDPSIFIAAGAGPGHQAMPSFAHLPSADIDAMVYFLSQQR